MNPEDADIASSLLSNEAETRKRIRYGLDGHRRDLDGVDKDSESGKRKIVAAAVLMGLLIRSTVADARTRSMRDALNLTGHQLQRITGGVTLAAMLLRMPSQDGRGATLGGRFADAFRTKVGTHDNPGDAVRALYSRGDTIAASEVSIAFNTQRLQAQREAVTQNPYIARRLVQVWNATLDRRTCPTCAGLDGKRAPLGGTFNGNTPGLVHARCRCWSSIERA